MSVVIKLLLNNVTDHKKNKSRGLKGQPQAVKVKEYISAFRILNSHHSNN